MVRSLHQRQRRAETILIISVDTLLRIHLGLAQKAELQHSIPIKPSKTVKILKQITKGISIDTLINFEEHSECSEECSEYPEISHQSTSTSSSTEQKIPKTRPATRLHIAAEVISRNG